MLLTYTIIIMMMIIIIINHSARADRLNSELFCARPLGVHKPNRLAGDRELDLSRLRECQPAV